MEINIENLSITELEAFTLEQYEIVEELDEEIKQVEEEHKIVKDKIVKAEARREKLIKTAKKAAASRKVKSRVLAAAKVALAKDKARLSKITGVDSSVVEDRLPKEEYDPLPLGRDKPLAFLDNLPTISSINGVYKIPSSADEDVG